MDKSIINAVDPNGNIIIIDIEKLRKYDRLKNATVFNNLFKINVESTFGTFPMCTNDKGHITILQFLNISNDDWSNLILFLENELHLINYMKLTIIIFNQLVHFALHMNMF